MPELPEVETVRRMLVHETRGRVIARARVSGFPLRGEVPRTLPRKLRGRRIEEIGRHGKYLLFDLSGGATLLSHLGMSGQWLFHAEAPSKTVPHLHARLSFE